MSLSKASANQIALGVGLLLASVPWRSADAKTIALEVDITIDQMAPEEQKPGMKLPMVHKACVFYDDTKIDPATKRVAILHETHAGGIPKHLNSQQMPVSNGWLDLSGSPIRYHFAAAPTTAFPAPYFVLFNEKTLRMTIYKQEDGELLLAGNYTVNPKQFTGPAVEAVVASSDPVGPPWETAPQGFRPGPGAAPKAAPAVAAGPKGAEPAACPSGDAS
jgi:hypothetical protein